MPVRRIARPLFASWFVAEGLDALRRPEPHVARTQACWQDLASRVGLPAVPPPDTLRTLVQVHGGAMSFAALMLATGRAPRAAAVALAALSVPLAVVNQPFGGGAGAVASAGDSGAPDRPIGATGGVVTGTVAEGGSGTSALQERFLRNLTMIGGALLVALDREGRPGVVWRVQHGLQDRAAAREAGAAVAAATKQARVMVAAANKEAKAALRESRRAASAVS